MSSTTMERSLRLCAEIRRRKESDRRENLRAAMMEVRAKRTRRLRWSRWESWPKMKSQKQDRTPRVPTWGREEVWESKSLMRWSFVSLSFSLLNGLDKANDSGYNPDWFWFTHISSPSCEVIHLQNVVFFHTDVSWVPNLEMHIFHSTVMICIF